LRAWPSPRPWGLLKESFAGGAALTKVATDANANGLVKAVVADFSTGEGRSAARDGLKAEFSGGKPADIKTKSIDSLRQVSALLSAKAPGDASAFKAWLHQISQSTAEAASEGGRKGDPERDIEHTRRLIELYHRRERSDEHLWKNHGRHIRHQG
jgi:hypothetical protein